MREEREMAEEIREQMDKLNKLLAEGEKAGLRIFIRVVSDDPAQRDPYAPEFVIDSISVGL